MKQFKLLILLLVIGFVAEAQINYLPMNSRYKWIAGKFDSTLHIPSGTTPGLRTGGWNGSGALFYRTSDSTVYVYTGNQWISISGGTGSNIQQVLTSGSTLNQDNSIDVAGYEFTIDNALNIVLRSTNGNSLFYVEDDNSYLQAESARITAHRDSIALTPPNGKIYIDSIMSGSSTDSVLVWDQSTGMVKKRNASAFGGGGSGDGIASLGTSAYGLITQNDSTYKVDTALVSTKLWRQKGIDSVQANVNLKLNISDTATMLSGYTRVTRFLDSLSAHTTRFNGVTSSLAAKLNISDTANKWITSVYRKTESDSVFYVKGGTNTFAFKDSIGSVGVSDTSVFIVDTLYNRLAHTINVDSLRLKSLRMQLNGSTITPTTTDSTLSFNISTLDTTTVPLITFTAGAGFAADTAMVTDSSLFGSLYTGQYQYTIKEIQAVIKGNSGDSVVLKIVYNDTFNVDGTKINGAGISLNNRYLGNTFTVSTNRTVSTNSWLWIKPEAVIAGKKPKYISVTLLGYKTYVAP